MRRDVRNLMARALVFGLLFGFSSLAVAEKSEEATTTKSETTTRTKKKKSHGSKHATVDENADNTGKNERDRKEGEPTADQQKNDKSDLDVTAAIRRSIIADKSLSMYAHNVKIIAQNGAVTLKGPVQSAAEKTTIEQKAIAEVGKENVKSEIEIKP